jgi:hypothetical protein
MEFPEVARFSRRTKTLDVAPLEDGRIRFETSLVDRSFGGAYEPPDCDSLVLHDFRMEGTASGADLILETLSVRAEAHPFPQCPFIIPATEDLVGHSLLSKWRSNVLERFRGTSGCTHVTTLLLGLSEVTTLMYFQRMNEHRVYGPKTRASGEWIAGSLDLGQTLQGACHVLAAEGPVVRRAESFRERRDHGE